MSAILVWCIILGSVAILLFVAELFVPSGGLLAIAATVSLVASVVLCFMVNKWVGAGVCLALIFITPFAMAGAVSLWQRTPIGRKMVLTTTVGEPEKPRVLVGATGVTVTELRPMGECEFGEVRMESTSEMESILAAGTPVKVLSITDGVAMVRELKQKA